MRSLKTIRPALLGLALAAGVASAASATTTLTITDVETGNGDLGNVTVQDWGQPWTTPILMYDSKGVEHIVFCDDLNHDVNVGGGQHLSYQTGLVTVDGSGKTISEAVSNEMGQLADLGRYDYLHGNEPGAIAAQAAIWGIEYGKTVSSSDSTIEADILQDLQVKDNRRGYATGLISLSGTQSQIFGGVPEPATWLTMLLGLGLMGAALRVRRQKTFAAAMA